MTRTAVAFKEPLAPQVLSQAGVPLADAIWFDRLPPAAKVKALSIHPRGAAILLRVRKYMQTVVSSQSIEAMAS